MSAPEETGLAGALRCWPVSTEVQPDRATTAATEAARPMRSWDLRPASPVAVNLLDMTDSTLITCLLES